MPSSSSIAIEMTATTVELLFGDSHSRCRARRDAGQLLGNDARLSSTSARTSSNRDRIVALRLSTLPEERATLPEKRSTSPEKPFEFFRSSSISPREALSLAKQRVQRREERPLRLVIGLDSPRSRVDSSKWTFAGKSFAECFDRAGSRSSTDHVDFHE